MPFPNSPSNGQLATVNNLVYVYNSTKGVWNKANVAAPLVTNSISIPGDITTTGNLNVTGRTVLGFGSSGNVVIAANTTSTSTTTGALVVSGGLAVAGNVNTNGNVSITGNVIANNFYTADRSLSSQLRAMVYAQAMILGS
jgi:hypothetical protein